MPPPSSRFSALNNHLLNALEIESRNSMSDAAKEAVVMNSELREENDSIPVTDLAISCDGTWMKRGHTSLHCVTSVIGIDTGKILDLQVMNDKPYGPDCKIETLECVGHIQKRMGGRLMKLKRELKGKKLEDGKLLGGQHRLTDKEIHTLKIYYRKAIRDNVGLDVKAMQKAVWAIA
ncbi:hypothetical protein ANN_20442 [Periplaneta americana]|uniref:Mutator-like transposase domain-containing protein n=1 Tax=Periplaneta americana TaxID=6978 RepID=A0ABQ8SDC6_PERAM|nr:hypothetical protein ANN_20442 [Periplaneta americana]